MKITTTIDVALGRGQNMREHYKTTARRKEKEKKATKDALYAADLEADPECALFEDVLNANPHKGARITVVRPYSPSAGPMDSDNLSGSFKYPRDEIAAFLGVDDGSPRLHFIYQQTVAQKLGMSVKKGRTKASPDYDTRPTVTIEVMPVQDIDPQVKRVRELEECLRQHLVLSEHGWRPDVRGDLYEHTKLLLAPRIGGAPVLVDDNQPEGVVYMHMKG